MRSRWAMRFGAVALIVCCAYGGDEKPVRRYQIEVLYTVHVAFDTDEKLERIRALVVKAFPDAKFAEVNVADRKTYFGTYRDRLLKMAGQLPAQGPAIGQYEIVKAQVAREVELRSIYQFLHAQAKDDRSLKTIFDRLKEKDDPKNPVCATEPGQGLIVYRDFGGKALSGDELKEIEDRGVRFGFSFKPRVSSLGDADLPKVSRKADTLGDEGDGRQIFRLVAVTSAPEPPPDHK